MGSSVGVVIPCYNNRDFVAEAIRSVIGKAGQFVVVDDGSTDGSDEEISRLTDSYVRIRHSGLPIARNVGIACLKTDYILPLDADDILLGVPQEAIDMLDSGKVDVVYGNYVLDGGKLVPNKNIALDDFRRNNQLYPTSLFRKTAWERVKGYWDSDWLGKWYPEDWDFWARLMLSGNRFAYLDYDFCFHRVRKDSVWESVKDTQRAADGKEMVLKHIFG